MGRIVQSESLSVGEKTGMPERVGSHAVASTDPRRLVSGVTESRASSIASDVVSGSVQRSSRSSEYEPCKRIMPGTTSTVTSSPQELLEYYCDAGRLATIF